MGGVLYRFYVVPLLILDNNSTVIWENEARGVFLWMILAISRSCAANIIIGFMNVYILSLIAAVVSCCYFAAYDDPRTCDSLMYGIFLKLINP